jgi:hypothetical protein
LKKWETMTEKIIDNGFSLLRLVPAVLRARDFRLYTEGGRRLADLWQNGGAAILGHTPPSLLRELKNTAGRGLYAPFPHFLEGRCKKAMSRIFPGRDFRFYAAPPPALETLAAEGSAALWRPFLDPANPLTVPENAPPVLIPVLPCLQSWSAAGLPLGFCALAVKPGFEKNALLPPGGLLPPILLALAARGIYDLIAAAPRRAKPAFPRIAKALKNSRVWRRQGVYLTPKQPPPPEEWAAVFSRFLEAGFLLPPVPSQPAILPGILSPGEEAKLAELLTQG